MIVHIVEDDENKRKHIVELIGKEFPSISVREHRAYKSGLRAVLGESADVLLLDMTMPTFARSPSEHGGRLRHFAGRDFLDQLRARGKTLPVLVITQFELLGEGAERKSIRELDEELQADFPSLYRGLVYYHPAQSKWRQELSAFIRKHLRESH